MCVFLGGRGESIDFVHHFEEMGECRRAKSTDKGFLDRTEKVMGDPECSGIKGG